MVKIQKTTQGSFILSIPKSYLRHTEWSEKTHLAICPCENGLRLVELKQNGM